MIWLCLSVKPSEYNKLVTLQSCIADVQGWMSINFLQVNSKKHKTEVLIIGPDLLRE